MDNKAYSQASAALPWLEANQETVCQLWVQQRCIVGVFQQHQIDPEFFTRHFAIRVVRYFISAIRGEERIGECPAIMVMLEFFKKKEITVMDVYTICANFKNSLSLLFFESDQFQKEAYLELVEIIDWNFRGVLKGYIRKNHTKILDQIYAIPELLHMDEEGHVVAEPIETAPYESDVTPIEVELQTYEEDVLENDLNDLIELEEEIDSKAVLIAVGTSDHDVISVFSESLIRYGSILNNYPLFENLGKSIRHLGEAFASDFSGVMEDVKRFRSLCGHGGICP